MSEKSIYARIRSSVFNATDRVDRIENALVVGMPDVNYCCENSEGWIEIKSATEPKRASTKLFGSNHKLSQDQKNWIFRQIKAGGVVWILIETDKRLIFENGKFADKINDLTIAEIIEIARLSFAKPFRGEENWKLLRKLLIANSKQSHTTIN